MVNRIYDPGLLPSLELVETVQLNGMVVTQSRLTVQDPTKLPVTYELAGETVLDKLGHLRQLAAMRTLSQLELLAYLEDVTQAPLYLPSLDVLEEDLG